jgi:structure-specific endonuclease subunit SLX1
MEACETDTSEQQQPSDVCVKLTQNPTIKVPFQNGPYYCYIITNGERTYNGYTNNLRRRLRQHNGELRGGARATHNRGTWSYIAIMTSPEWNAIRAMENEWSIKHPTRNKRRLHESRFRGPAGRIESLKLVCQHIPEAVTLYVHSNYVALAMSLSLPSNVTVLELSECTVRII